MGNTHTIEVLLHVRHKDRGWFSQNSVRDQLLHLMTTRIVPREFHTEIERHHERVHGTMTATKTGEKNEKSLNCKVTAKAAGKRKRNPKAAPVVVLPLEKPRRDVRHVFDDNLHLTYRLQDLNSSAGATISVLASPDNHDGNLTFRQYPKLPKRLVVWCFPRNDQQDNTDQDTPDGGFPRPELIPIAGLFR